MTVEIPISADIDLAGLNQKLAQFTRTLNQMGEQIARANRVQFQPINRASLDMARQYENTIKNVARLAPELHKRLKATGQDQTAPESWQWERLYGDPSQRARAQRNFFTMATGQSFAPAPLVPTVPRQGGGGGGDGGGGRSGLADAFENILRAGGPMGGLAAGAVHTGRAAAMRGSIAGGIGAGVGFLAVQGLARSVSAIMERVSAAEQERIGYGDLYARMGGRFSNSSPGVIQGRGAFFGAEGSGLREASRAISVSYPEGLALGNLAARRGGITDAGDLAGAVTQGGGFARGFGFDPNAGVSAFAGLRGIGVTRDNTESMRLGLAIATGIARARVFGKAEDYLAEIATYGETTARSSLQATNLDGFNSALSALAGLKLPGLNVRGAGNLLSQADASLRQGGAAGEASQAFLYHTLGTDLGLSPIGAEIMQQGGLFATTTSMFGEGTVAGDYYRQNGLATPDLADNRTNFERVTEGLRRRYGNRPELLAHATGRMFGTNYAQSMALNRLTPEQLRGMGDMGLTSEQIGNLSGTGIATMGQIAAADRPGLDRIGNELEGRTGTGELDTNERRRLAAARQGTDEELRKVLADLQASRGQEQTDGQRIRSSILDVEKVLTQLADGIVDPIQTARDALLFLVRQGGGPGTAAGVRGAQRLADLAAVDTEEARAVRRVENEQEPERIALNSQISDAEREVRRLNAPRSTATPEDRAAAQANLDQLRGRLRGLDGALESARAPFQQERDKINRRYQAPGTPQGDGTLAPLPRLSGPDAHARELARFNEAARPAAERVAAQLGVPAETILGHWAGETRNGTAFAGSNNLGNITALPSQDATEGGDTDAQGRPIRQRFRNFRSLDEFADTYADWVRRRAPGAIGEQNARTYAQRLQAGGYATSPTFAGTVASTAARFSAIPRPQATPIPAAPPTGAQATPLPAAPPLGAQATPMSPDAPPGAAPAAGQGGAPAPVTVQGTMAGEVVVRLPDGTPIGPPAPVSGQFRAARPAGATIRDMTQGAR